MMAAGGCSGRWLGRACRRCILFFGIMLSLVSIHLLQSATRWGGMDNFLVAPRLASQRIQPTWPPDSLEAIPLHRRTLTRSWGVRKQHCVSKKTSGRSPAVVHSSKARLAAGRLPRGSYQRQGISTAVTEASPQARLEEFAVRRQSMWYLLPSITLSVLGIVMTNPVMPEFRSHFGLQDGQVGAMSSAYAFGILLSALTIPGLSDRVGRKPVLVGVHFISAIGLLLQGIAISCGWSFHVFLVLRFLTGIATCNPVFKAYIASAVPRGEVAEYMVWREAASSVAMFLSPLLAPVGMARFGGTAGVLYTMAGAHLIAAVLLTFLDEPRQVDKEVAVAKEGLIADGQPAVSVQNRFTRAFAAVKRHTYQGMVVMCKPSLLLVFAMSNFYVFGLQCYASFFSLLLVDCLKLTTVQIARFMSRVSLLCLVLQVLFSKRVARWGFVRMGMLGGVSLMLSYALFAFAALLQPGDSLLFIVLAAAAFLDALGLATFPAAIGTLIARSVPPSQCGMVMGWDSVCNNVCRTVAPILLGLAYGQHPSLCFAGASAMMLVVLLCFRSQQRLVVGE